MGPMTQAAYARHRGVSKTAVGKMVKAGRIPFQEVGGKILIDAAEADFALGNSMQRVNEPRPPSPGVGRSLPLPGDEAETNSGRLTKARADDAEYSAKMRRLEYERQIGEVLPIAEVERAMQVCAEALVRDIDQLPAHADDLAAALARDGVNGLRRELKGLARRMRDTLARSMTAKIDETDEEPVE